MKNYKVFVIGLFFVIILLVCVENRADEDENDLHIDFFQLIGAERDEISEIFVDYLGVSVPLNQNNRNEILDCFENAVCVEILKSEPFTMSEFKLIIETEVKIANYEFCWFNGILYDEAGQKSGYADRRFDVCVGENWYVFRQADENFWNEDKMNSAYKQSALETGVDLPSRDEIEGIEMKTVMSHLPYNPDNGRWSIQYNIWDYFQSAEEIIEKQECIIIGKCVGAPYVLTGKSEDFECYTQGFEVIVQDILKGELSSEQIYLMPQFGRKLINDKQAMTYPCMEAPALQIGQTYLLSLSDVDCAENNQYQYAELDCCAKICDEVIYPNYNTEYHPLYQVELDDIKKYCLN